MHCLPVGASLLQAITDALDRNAPVVVFLNLTRKQVSWMQTQVDAYDGTAGAVTRTVLPDFVVDTSESAAPYVGHAVLAVGVSGDYMLLRNNFGNAWGARGRFSVKTAYVPTPQFHAAVAVAGVSH